MKFLSLFNNGLREVWEERKTWKGSTFETFLRYKTQTSHGTLCFWGVHCKYYLLLYNLYTLDRLSFPILGRPEQATTPREAAGSSTKTSSWRQRRTGSTRTRARPSSRLAEFAKRRFIRCVSVIFLRVLIKEMFRFSAPMFKHRSDNIISRLRVLSSPRTPCVIFYWKCCLVLNIHKY